MATPPNAAARARSLAEPIPDLASRLRQLEQALIETEAALIATEMGERWDRLGGPRKETIRQRARQRLIARHLL